MFPVFLVGHISIFLIPFIMIYIYLFYFPTCSYASRTRELPPFTCHLSFVRCLLFGHSEVCVQNHELFSHISNDTRYIYMYQSPTLKLMISSLILPVSIILCDLLLFFLIGSSVFLLFKVNWYCALSTVECTHIFFAIVLFLTSPYV